MAQTVESPCGVLFDVYKSFAGISNRDLANVILTSRPLAGGRSPRERALEDKTYLSRSIVRSKPGDLLPSVFSDFAESAHSLYSMMRSSSRFARTTEQIVACFSGEGAAMMAQACRNFQLDGVLYMNTVRRIMQIQGISEADRAYLLVLLFLQVGCLQDTRQAALDVLQMAERMFSSAPETQTAGSYERENSQEGAFEDVRLALFRVRNKRLSGSPHLLSVDPQGTEIGYLSMSPESITDVEETVSRRHLLIFRDESGRWFARGLGSRNGSLLISGDDRSEVIIEPPRSRAEGFQKRDVQINPGDKLVLARDTIFMVMQMDASSL